MEWVKADTWEHTVRHKNLEQHDLQSSGDMMNILISRNGNIPNMLVNIGNISCMVYTVVLGKPTQKRIPHNQRVMLPHHSVIALKWSLILIYLSNATNGMVMKGDSVQDTSSRDRESAMVTMYSEGPTKARQRLSLLTVRASGARSVPRATTLPSQSGTEWFKQHWRRLLIC